jgi:outer membrane protein assembly factor BamB
VVDLGSGSVKPFDGPAPDLPYDRARIVPNRPCDPDTRHGRVTIAGAALVFEQLGPTGWNKRATLPSTLAATDQINWHALIGNRLLVADAVQSRRYELDVHAFDLTSGRELWNMATTRHGISCTDLGHDRIGLDLADGVSAIDLDTGRVRFKIPVTAEGTVAVTNLGGERWLAIGDRALASFDGATGKVAWRHPVVGSELRTTVVIDTRLLVGLKQLDASKTHAKFVLVTYDLRSGAVRRRATLTSPSWDKFSVDLDSVLPRTNDPGHVLVAIGTYAPVGP